MKKIVAFIPVCLLLLACNNTFAQCTINNGNSSTGFYPLSLPCITQDSVYGQTVQIYIPSSFDEIPIDSVTITGISGLPAGITADINPASGTIHGDGQGCIWFSGTTSDTLGTYSLTFSGSAVTGIGTLPLSQLSSFISYSLSVCAISICDTLFNLASPSDTPGISILTGEYSGYFAGNNSYGDLAKAEEMRGAAGGIVSGAWLSFGHVSINLADSASTIKAYLWDNNFGPGLAIDSSTITLGAIAAEVTASNIAGTPQYIYVPFNAAAPLSTSLFYVGVKLPSTAGDTVAFFTNITGAGGLGWSQYAGLSWHGYGEGEGNYIKAAICATGANPVAAFSPLTGCSGDALHLTDNSINSPNQWNWTFSGGTPATSTSQTPSVTYATTGTHNITLISTNLFGTDSITQSVNIYQSPGDSVISNTPATNSTTANGSIMVTGTGGVPPYTYAWNANSDSTATLSNAKAADYVVTITDSRGCYVRFSVSIIAGINELGDNNQIKIYPNPAGEQLNIQWSIVPDADVSIIDMNGKTLRQFIAKGSQLNTVDVRDLSSGAYIIRITDRNTNQVQSAIFEKLQ